MTALAALARFAHLAAVLALFGTFVFALAIARPAVGARSGWRALHRRIAWWSLGVAALTALALLVLQAVNVSEQAMVSVSSLAPLLAETRFGHVWMMRAALIAALAVLLLPKRDAGGASLATGALLSAMLLATGALGGHAAAGEGSELAVQASVDALHLLAAGAWLGGLVPLWHLLRDAGIEPAAQRRAARRFSAMGCLCVGILLLSGVANAVTLIGGWPELLGTAYGHLLLAKLALLAPMLALAAFNLFRLAPAIDAGSGREPGRRLARNALIEAALGVAIVLIVGWLGVTPPARHVAPDWPFAFRWDWTIVDRDAAARSEVENGYLWVYVALTSLTFSFFTARFAKWVIGAGLAMLFVGAWMIVQPIEVDAYPTTYVRPVVPYQAISVANGRRLYGEQCSRCHGGMGRGDGPASATTVPRASDLLGRRVSEHTAGDLYWWISSGVGASMPAFASVLAEEDRWDLVNFLRALRDGERARTLTPVVDARTRIAAPDFDYATGGDATRSLRDWRGERMVLLVLGDDASMQARLKQLDAAAMQLQGAGLVVLPVPAEGTVLRTGAIPVLTEGNAEIRAAYALFSRSKGEERLAPLRHLEWLIDRQGYLRARWIASEGGGWQSVDALLKQALLLRTEPPKAPVPDEHVH